MDSSEQTGFAAAVAIHVLLAAGLWLGLQESSEPILPKPDSIAISLIGETAPVSTAPDAIQEEPAPASVKKDPAPSSDPAPGAPSVLPTLVPRVTPTPVRKITATLPKPVQPNPTLANPTPAKPTPAKPTPAKKIASSKALSSEPTTRTNPPKVTSRKSGGFGRGFEQTIAGIGSSANSNASASSSGAGKASGTPAAKSAAQVRRDVTVSLKNEIAPFFRKCAPRGLDVNLLISKVTLNISKSGELISTDFNGQNGVNASNSPQAVLHKQCALDAVRAASPYRNLPPEGYDVWKSWQMEFNTR